MREKVRRAAGLQLPFGVVVLAAAAAGLVGLVLVSWLRERELVTGSPALIAVLLGLVVLTGTRSFHLLVGRGRVDTHPVLRLVLAYSLFAPLAWAAGWSFVLPASAILVGVVHIQRSGARVWLPALLVVAGFTLAGQVGVALGVVGTVADPAVSHMAAATIFLLTASGLLVAGSAVAEREGVQARLQRTEARLRALMESSADILTVSDARGALTYVSPAVSRGLGRTPEELLGTHLLDHVDVEHRPRVASALAAVVDEGTDARASFDVLVELASHERRWFAWSVHNLLGDPLVAGLVIVQSDITDRHRHQEALAHAATHDDLTGLPNRAGLLDQIEEAAGQAAPSAGVAVLFLDLDRFKEVNDEFGHAAGDEVLVAIARRLRGVLRPHDHLARVSGDEFCAVLTEVRDQPEMEAVVERLQEVVGRPVALAGDTGTLVHVGVSVGRSLTFGPHSAEELLTSADTAMYRDKRSRRRSAPGGPRSHGGARSDAPAAGAAPA